MDITNPPELFRHMSVDDVAETVDGLHESAYTELWEALAAAEEAGTAKPVGGDGSNGTTEEPIVSSGEYGSDLVAAWPNLSEATRINIWECAGAMAVARARRDGGGQVMPTIHQPERLVGGVTNQERADWALETIRTFGGLVYNDGNGEDLTTAAGDLIGNMMHLAASAGLDPKKFLADALEAAIDHYDAEAHGEPHEGESPAEFLQEPTLDPDNWLNPAATHDDT
jgi:hypothetical protein